MTTEVTKNEISAEEFRAHLSAGIKYAEKAIPHLEQATKAFYKVFPEKENAVKSARGTLKKLLFQIKNLEVSH